MKLLLFILFLVHPLYGQALSLEQIAKKIKATEALPDSEEKLEILPLWNETLQAATATQAAKTKAKEHQDRAIKIAGLTTLSIPTPPDESASLAEHSAFLEALNASIESANARKLELESEESVSSSRNVELGKMIAKTKADLGELQIGDVPASAVGQAEHQRALQLKARYEAELAQIQAEQDLIRKRSETLPDRIARRDEQLVKLREMLANTRRKIASLRAEQTQSTRESISDFEKKFTEIPALQEIVDEIRKLNETHTAEQGVDAKLSAANNFLEDVLRKKEWVGEQARSAETRIKLLDDAGLGVDSETGLILRGQRAQLPSISELESDLRENVVKLAQAQIYETELRERLTAPAIPPAEVSKILKQNPNVTRAEVNELLEKRKELLTSLSTDYQTLSSRLSQATTTAKLTIIEIQNYSNFLDQRLLWIRSTSPVSASEPLDEWKRIVTLFSPAMLEQAWVSISEYWFSNLLSYSLCLVLIIYVMVRRKKLLQRIESSSALAARRNCTSIVPTWKTIISSVVLASALPALVLIFVILFAGAPSYQRALTHVVVFLFVTGVLYKFSRKQGLFVSHLKVDPKKSQTLFRNLTWFIPVILPFVFVIGALIETDSNQSSGRLAFMSAMLVVAFFFHRLLHPSRSILKNGDEVTVLVRGVYFLAIGTPLIFIVGAALGYFASVLTLRAQVMATVGLVVLSFLSIRFFGRWILVSRRRLAIDQAILRREAFLAERAREEDGETNEREPDLPSLEEVKAQAVNVVEVEVQTTQLLRLSVYFAASFGIWAIWASTLPALEILDKVTIFENSAVSTEAEKEATATPLASLTGTEEKPEEEAASDPAKPAATEESSSALITDKVVKLDDGRVSLQDLFVAILITVVTFVAARNIPGLLSLTIFNRIKLGPGGNFALTTTARYLIVLIGVVMALGMIGITWGKVQWLAAAITLGIGFGLQEIFANFVAGIIMLFERPVRLGDIVTVGDVSGKVTQINIRATTIQQFNNRELLVPNKEFITSQLVNWTLRDTVLRFEIVVGIAYGSDTKLATRILKRILAKHPKILKDPRPDVLFSTFGPSSLDFTVRAFVGSVEDLIVTQSEMHYLIDDAFREDGIEIAFPQQDIHIRSLPAQMNFPSPS